MNNNAILKRMLKPGLLIKFNYIIYKKLFWVRHNCFYYIFSG